MDLGGNRFINKQQIPEAEFSSKLSEVLQGRQSKVVFFAADGDLEYGKVAAFMDQVRDSGVENLGIVFDYIRPAGAAAGAAGGP